MRRLRDCAEQRVGKRCIAASACTPVCACMCVLFLSVMLSERRTAASACTPVCACMCVVLSSVGSALC
jgi:hypothetical protein